MGFMWLVTLNIFVSSFLYKIVYCIRYINYHASDSLPTRNKTNRKENQLPLCEYLLLLEKHFLSPILHHFKVLYHQQIDMVHITRSGNISGMIHHKTLGN